MNIFAKNVVTEIYFGFKIFQRMLTNSIEHEVSYLNMSFVNMQ